MGRPMKAIGCKKIRNKYELDFKPREKLEHKLLALISFMLTPLIVWYFYYRVYIHFHQCNNYGFEAHNFPYKSVSTSVLVGCGLASLTALILMTLNIFGKIKQIVKQTDNFDLDDEDIDIDGDIEEALEEEEP